MDKDNVFRSSSFHMDNGDILHLLLIDETGTLVTLNLNGETTSNVPLVAPTAIAETDVTGISFTANWTDGGGAQGFYLDVARDAAFTIMLPGYDNLDVGMVLSYPVTGLMTNADYYYRVRAYASTVTTVSSNVRTVVYASVAGAPCLIPFDLSGGGFSGDSITLLSNHSWSLDTEEAWITPNKTSGTGNDFITLTIGATGSPRAGVIRFYLDGALADCVDVIQKALVGDPDPDYFFAFPDTINFGLDGAPCSGCVIKLRTSLAGAWTIVKDKSWITVTNGLNAEVTSDTGSYTLKVEVEPGTADTGTIEFQVGAVTMATVTIERNTCP